MRKNERPTIPAKPSVSKQGNAVPKQGNADETTQGPKKVAESHLYESAVPKNAGESKSVMKSNPTQHKEPMTFTVGDSVAKDVKGWLLFRERFVRTYSFSGADTTDMHDFIRTLLKKKPEEIILHVGTNDLTSTLNATQIVDEILKLRLIIVSYGINCTISTIVKRDDGCWVKATEVNQVLFNEVPADQLIDNSHNI